MLGKNLLLIVFHQLSCLCSIFSNRFYTNFLMSFETFSLGQIWIIMQLTTVRSGFIEFLKKKQSGLQLVINV